MPTGRCQYCGYLCYGWALLNPRNQTCPGCGARLLIIEDGHRVADEYSPLTARKYSVGRIIDMPAFDDTYSRN